MSTATQNVTHTRGPWHRPTMLNGDTLQMAIVAADGTEVAQAATWGGDGWEQCERNAQLIAAAPELLKAIQDLLAYANAYSDRMCEIGRGAEELGTGADSVSVAGMARAAIAKATR